MISFKDYLIEGRDAPLYHATNLEAAVEILKSGFRTGTSHYNKKFIPSHNKGSTFGLSTSRDKRFIKHWIYSNISNGVVFELDQKKLSHNYKIHPVNYWMDNINGARAMEYGDEIGATNPDNEYEEFVVDPRKKNGTAIIPLKYVTGVYYYTGNRMKNMKDYMNDHHDEGDVSKILSHPLFRGEFK